MENAGQAAATDLLRRFPKAGRALIVCGKGNNGGDGLVIARVLSGHDWQVDVAFVLGDKLSSLAQLNQERLNQFRRCQLLSAPMNWKVVPQAGFAL